MAAMALRRWGEEPPATERARRQEQARARMCSPVSRLPLSAVASLDLIRQALIIIEKRPKYILKGPDKN